jgi:hypothetical protein
MSARTATAASRIIELRNPGKQGEDNYRFLVAHGQILRVIDAGTLTEVTLTEVTFVRNGIFPSFTVMRVLGVPIFPASNRSMQLGR